MHGFIYLIRNTVTGGGYVGQTVKQRPVLRWYEHKWALRHGQGNPRFRHSFHHHGEHVFQFEVLEQVYAADLNALRPLLTQREDAWMQRLRQEGVDLYNAVSAGDSVAGKPYRRTVPTWNVGIPMTEEAKKRLSASKTGVPSPKKGIPLTDEQKAKVSASLQGNSRRKGTTTSAQGRVSISASKKGQPSPNRGKAMSEAQKLKLSAAKSGSTHTDTTRAKMRESAKGRTWTLVDGIRVYSGTKDRGAA